MLCYSNGTDKKRVIGRRRPKADRNCAAFTIMLRSVVLTCLRSKWKYCAGVVGNATWMFTSSASTASSLLSHAYIQPCTLTKPIFERHLPYVITQCCLPTTQHKWTYSPCQTGW